ncbi:MAG TPA: SusC/RagA family TonB-linked outer membrane protein [Cytophagales bacterium]|mgnify:CR=1 FL=1|nr:SusC/RagA family TonB-linked outer membrane protein [Cytophagales bacterium]
MKRILLFLFSFVFVLTSMAQERVVSGKVTSQDDGSGLPGVNVLVKGTATGTVTDADGAFRLSVPSTGSTTLVFTFIGFQTQEVQVGERSIIDVSMGSDVTQLSEVVVTALGLEKQSRELGYSVSGVKAEDLDVARDANILNALQGKVTGVNITQSSGNLGGSTKVTIRGVTSLSGNNNPLWVVDGVPINDNQDATGSRITGSRDFANGAAVINPDDIASVNILKGAAASALYGSRAAGGVIVVTTKKGKATSGRPEVSVNSSVRFDNLFKVPEYQNVYSQGNFGKYDSSAFNNWGARIVGQTVTESITNNQVPLRAYPDNYKEFYRTGKTLINNVAFSDANQKGDYRLSITSLNQEGILPNAELDRLTVSLNAGMKHSEKLRSRFAVQYINTESQGTGVAGANDPNVLGVNIFTNTINVKNYRPWIDESGNQINTVALTDNNPFWVQFENKNERRDSRFIGNFETAFSPIQELTFLARLGYDYDQDSRLITNRVGTRSRATGDFTIDNINRTQFNIDAIATYFKTINSDLSLKVLAGYNFNRRVFRNENLFAQGLSIPELFSPSNALTSVPQRAFNERVLFGAYGEVDLSYKDWATLTLTARNDWSSTLPKDNRSYFYPSASLAVVFTDALNMQSNFLSYGKLRLSAAQVGNDTNPYRLNFEFFPQPSASGQYSLNQNFPFDGRLGFQATTTIPPENLKPEQQTSFEVGTELRFLDGRFGLDVSAFNTVNSNQILQTPIPPATGFRRKTLNVGEITNTGIEFTLDAKVLRTSNFEWSTILNFSHVESEVTSLAEGTEQILIASEFNSIQIVAVPGREYQIFAIPYLRDTITGKPVINPNTGLRQAGETKLFGSVLPDFTAGITNVLSYKGIVLSTTIDMKWGGIMSSSTVGGLWAGGVTEETLRNREGTFIDKGGILLNTDGTARENDVPARSAEEFWQGLRTGGIAESQIFDASFIKLREIGISYRLPASVLGNGFIKGLQVGVEGRNLALLYSKVPHIDPEASLFGSGVDGFGSERNTIPSTRSIGFNVKLKF